MRALPITAARHFVRELAGRPGAGIQSVAQFVELNHPKATVFVEGSTEFDALRRCMLREADTYVLLATTCYSRSLVGLQAASSAWCVTGLYYASFFAAKAVLAMLGGWYDSDESWIEVAQANPGQQSLVRHVGKYKLKYPSPGIRGSHEWFWAAYYAGAGQLSAWISANSRFAVAPIGNNVKWFIQLRNRLNYKPAEAFGLMRSFEAGYDGNVPKCLPGDLSSAYEVSKSFLMGMKEVGQYCGLKTDLYRPRRSRGAALATLVIGPQARPIKSFGVKESKAVVF